MKILQIKEIILHEGDTYWRLSSPDGKKVSWQRGLFSPKDHIQLSEQEKRDLESEYTRVSTRMEKTFSKDGSGIDTVFDAIDQLHTSLAKINRAGIKVVIADQNIQDTVKIDMVAPGYNPDGTAGNIVVIVPEKKG